VQVADGAGGDLVHAGAGAAEAPGVVVGRKISHQGGDTVVRVQAAQGFFQKGRLAGAGARHQVDNIDAGSLETAAQVVGEKVVLLEDALADLNDPGLHGSLPPELLPSRSPPARTARARGPARRPVSVYHRAGSGNTECLVIAARPCSFDNKRRPEFPQFPGALLRWACRPRPGRRKRAGPRAPP